LTWFRNLVALRRSNAALRYGSFTMLDAGNRDVIAYARTSADGSGVVVSVNCSSQPRTISLDIGSSGMKGTHLTTLATDDPALRTANSISGVTLAPFASWVVQVQ
jgi:alpha-glucosidase